MELTYNNFKIKKKKSGKLNGENQKIKNKIKKIK